MLAASKLDFGVGSIFEDESNSIQMLRIGSWTFVRGAKHYAHPAEEMLAEKFGHRDLYVYCVPLVGRAVFLLSGLKAGTTRSTRAPVTF